MKELGHLAFHQGWTDIACQLSLINFYAPFYNTIKLYIRKEAIPFVSFYTRQFDNVQLVSCENHCHILEGIDYSTGDRLFHGSYDQYRNDKYQHRCAGHNPGGYDFFIEAFYGLYDIPYSFRTSLFGLTRDKELEDSTFESFTAQFGTQYILLHDNQNNSRLGPYHVDTKICLPNPQHPCINLNQRSQIFWDYIVVIANARELHLIDSVWGAIIYQLDARYGLFSHIPIFLYAQRGHDRMFNSPIKLPNWTIL